MCPYTWSMLSGCLRNSGPRLGLWSFYRAFEEHCCWIVNLVPSLRTYCTYFVHYTSSPWSIELIFKFCFWPMWPVLVKFLQTYISSFPYWLCRGKLTFNHLLLSQVLRERDSYIFCTTSLEFLAYFSTIMNENIFIGTTPISLHRYVWLTNSNCSGHTLTPIMGCIIYFNLIIYSLMTPFQPIKEGWWWTSLRY